MYLPQIWRYLRAIPWVQGTTDRLTHRFLWVNHLLSRAALDKADPCHRVCRIAMVEHEYALRTGFHQRLARSGCRALRQFPLEPPVKNCSKSKPVSD
jgi:hypothetical protein